MHVLLHGRFPVFRGGMRLRGVKERKRGVIIMENGQVEKSVWRMVGGEYGSGLERNTAIMVKESDAATYCVYQGDMNRPEYWFSFSDKTGYDIEPDFRFTFGAFVFPNLFRALGENHWIFPKNRYYPSLIRRDFEITNLGLKGSERMGRPVEGGLTWRIGLHCVSEKVRLREKLFSVIRFQSPCCVSLRNGTAEIRFSDTTYYLAYRGAAGVGVYDSEDRMMEDLAAEKLNAANQKGRYLVISEPVDLDSGENLEISYGMSRISEEKASEAFHAGNMEETIRENWDRWFSGLPGLRFKNEEERKAYYKSWWTIRSNYYQHPVWGFSIMESILVYKGVWQWAMPAVELYSDQDADHTSVWVKKAMDMFVNSQREDGYITHAIYVDEEHPGESWMQGKGTVQTPHFPSVALRYYYVTGDIASLRHWYRAFEKYYRYLCRSRDEDYENLHLWAVLTSFDTGLDTAPVFQKVTYGENGQKEEYCYPAIFAAERASYEMTMGTIADILGEDSENWRGEAGRTMEAMEKVLWDNRKMWYGVRHQDGVLDTRVGVDGLFPFAYRLADPRRAGPAKENFRKLIGNYGVRTLAEGEPGFREDIYWRGPAWPKSCSLAAAVCRNYYPDLSDRVQDSICRMVLSHPNVWECYNADTGELARSDMGFVCTPGIASNVGAGGILESIFTYHGFDMQGRENVLPMTEMSNFHWNGMRISVEEHGKDQWRIHAVKRECAEGTVGFFDGALHTLEAEKLLRGTAVPKNGKW